MRSAELRMSDAEVAQTLAACGQRMVVGTLAADGQPHLTVVWYGFIGDRIAFTVPAKSQKAANLRRDPRITLLVDGGEAHGNLHGVQITGRARLDDSLATKLAVHDSVARRYETKRSADLERTMSKRLAVVVEPTTVTSWDHRKLPRRDR